LNELQQQGYGCLTLKQEEVRPLYGTVSKLDELPVGPKCCLGAGTGLGECYLTPDDDGSTYTCYPSEGGHVEYAPRNDLEVEMFKYLLKKFSGANRISVERVVSGVGLANVYDFLAHKYPNRVEKTVHEEFLKAGDEQGRVVATNAKPGSLCYQAMEIMMSAYGCETGSAAIKWIPTGGLFLTGGLTPKNIGFIEGLDTDFMKAYINKGRLSPLLERIPLFAVMTEDLGVRGAHKAALMVYKQYMDERNGSSPDRGASLFKFFNENSLTLVAAVVLSFAIGVATSKRF
jgi:glucokinase